MKIGLVLEGGGMRGLYTIGVLDAMADNQMEVDYVIGVSAGACNGVSYVSGQRGRSYRVNLTYSTDKRYLSFQNLVKTGSLFGMDFVFEEIAHKLDPFDYDAFLASPMEFVTGITDVETGKTAYFPKEAMRYDTTLLRASSAIPLFSPMVNFKGRNYLDGGTTDPIPVRKALEDGCDKVIVVLTRQWDYVKKPQSLQVAYSRAFHKYPEMVRALKRRHEVYNETRRYVAELCEVGTAFVICPQDLLGMDRFEKNKEKLDAVYQNGYKDFVRKQRALQHFLYEGK